MFYKFIRSILITLSILSGIIFIILIKDVNSDYKQVKIRENELVKITGNIKSYKIDNINNSTYYLDIKLQDYNSTFQFSSDSLLKTVDWAILEDEIQNLDECNIWVVQDDKKNIQKNKGVDIQQLKINGKLYIKWSQVKKYYCISLVFSILLIFFCLFACLFFIYLVVGKKYLEMK